MFFLKLFGGAALEGPDGALTNRAAQRQRLALLALLAASGSGGMSRDKLLAYLWPEVDTERARHLLSNSLYILRQALGEDSLIGSADAVRLNPGRVNCDVRQFNDALAQGEFARAVALYSGPFLDGFFLSGVPEFENWMELEREQLASAYARAVEALAEAAEAESDFRGAAEWWKRRAALDPLDSRVALRLMQALESAGNPAGALQQGAVHRRLLEEELGVDAPPEIAALEDRLRRERPTRLPATRGEARTPDIPPAPTAAHSSGEMDTLAPARLPSLPSAGPPAPAPAASARGWNRRWGWAAAAVALALAGVLGTLRATSPRSMPPERSIVVLPFVSLSSSQDDEYFGDGLTEEVIARLAAVPELKVISRTSAMHYKGSNAPLRRIAAELDVTHVLEGSVRHADGRVRVTAQLIDARTDEHRWARNYEYDLTDALRLQEEIAQEVVRALEVELGEPVRRVMARQGTRDPAAHQLYRRGRFHWTARTEEGHRRAIEYYTRAIELDSTYADAYAGLADVYLTAYQLGLLGITEEEAYSRVKWAAERALALDDLSADAHTSFAVSLWWQRNWPGAERELRRAIALNPGNASARSWYALLLAGMGRMDEAVEQSRVAAELDPFALIISLTHGWACHMARDYDCAIEQNRRTLEINDEWAPTYSNLALAYAGKEMHEAAEREMSRALELQPGRAWLLADLAYVHAAAGRKHEARQVLQRAKTGTTSALGIARVYAALGEPDSAFTWLERSDWQWPHRALRADPTLDPVRADPRFAALEARVDREMGMR